jgi:hypothetical protein
LAYINQAGVVADASGRGATVELIALGIFQPKLVMEFARMGVEVVDEGVLT